MKKSASFILLFICFSTLTMYAQNEVITLSGTIISKEEHKKAIPFVNVYNKSTKEGTISDTEGQFSIQIGKNDTILFSTVQHIEQEYYIKEGEFFHDKNIVIDLHQDTIWLKTVSVMGFKEYDEFKKEVIALKLPHENISYAMPTINKYAKQHATGEGAIELKEPLTYLLEKMNILDTRGKDKLKQE